MKHIDSGKAYQVKKAKSARKKRRKELKRQIKEARKKGQPTIGLELLLALE